LRNPRRFTEFFLDLAIVLSQLISGLILWELSVESNFGNRRPETPHGNLGIDSVA